MDQDDSSLDSLLATAADLKQRLAFVEREIAQRTQDPAALAAELRSTRSYAASATEADCVARASKALTHYGFTVIDDVIIDVNVVIFTRVFFIDCLFGTKPRETGSARFPSGLR